MLLAAPLEDVHTITGRGGVRQTEVRGSTTPGTSGRPGIGVFRHGGAMVCSVGVLLMSGKSYARDRVEVIRRPKILEPVRGRQRVGVIAKMVLAELAGVVAEIEQELPIVGVGSQVGRAAGQLRRDHAGAQRIYAGEEGIPAGRAACSA